MSRRHMSKQKSRGEENDFALALARGAAATAAANAANSTNNSATIAAAASIVAPAVGDLPAQSSAFDEFLVSAVAYVRHSAVDHAMTAQLIEDPGGAASLFGPVITFDSSHVNANGNVAIPPVKRTPGEGAVRKYAMIITNGAAGTVTVLAANEAQVTVQPLA